MGADDNSDGDTANDGDEGGGEDEDTNEVVDATAGGVGVREGAGCCEAVRVVASKDTGVWATADSLLDCLGRNSTDAAGADVIEDDDEGSGGWLDDNGCERVGCCGVEMDFFDGVVMLEGRSGAAT